MRWSHPHTGVVAFLAGLVAAHDWRVETAVVMLVFGAGWFGRELVRGARRLVGMAGRRGWRREFR